ncbi:MAG: TolC family protein [Odoribacter sp.]|nr:TolC family protein [Odoribacter sp.]
MNWKWLTVGMMLFSFAAGAQEKPVAWDLRTCIEYARAKNIRIQQSRIGLEESLENTREAKAQRLPSLSFSSGHNYVNRPRPEAGDKNSYSGSYDLSSSVTLYGGGRLRKNLQQMELRNEVQELTIREAENNIELAITQAYVQLLYAHENVKINEHTVEVSKAQRDRGEQLLEAGALSRADFAQLESQYTTAKYQLVVAQTSLENARLDLKQLLELELDDTMEPAIPEIGEEEVLVLLPSKASVYQTSLGVMPEVKYNRLNIEVAGLEKEKAWAGYLPSLRLSAGMGTSHSTGSNWGWGSQMKHNWSENVGLTLSVPIFSNRSTKTAVNLAKLNVQQAELGYEDVQKDLLKSVETVYQDALSAQERYRSAAENLKAVELAFELTQEQFFLGMKNTLEMLTEKNNYLSARQELVQAKYMAVLNVQLLNFYQGKEIKL